MTNKEAIRRILDHKRVHSLNEPRAVLINEALDLAIKALEESDLDSKHCNTCLHYQQLTSLQELGYCETKNYHVSANSDKCIHYKEKQ